VENRANARPELSIDTNGPLWPQLSLADRVLHGLMYAVTLCITLLVLFWASSLGFPGGAVVQVFTLLVFSSLTSRLFGNGEPVGACYGDNPGDDEHMASEWENCGAESGEGC